MISVDEIQADGGVLYPGLSITGIADLTSSAVELQAPPVLWNRPRL
jgi:hypothetical protein